MLTGLPEGASTPQCIQQTQLFENASCLNLIGLDLHPGAALEKVISPCVEIGTILRLIELILVYVPGTIPQS